jgi:hypothetical protein
MDYTKGPWRYDQDNHKILSPGNSTIAYPVTQSIGDDIIDKRKAYGNAELMARAPKMLEALMALRVWLEVNDKEGNALQIRLIDETIAGFEHTYQ